jgi:hypothetical protein
MIDENDENLSIVANSRFAVSPEALRPAPLAVNLTYHGGDVINTARVVCIFWGPTWASGGSDAANASTIRSFRNQLGTSSHYSMLTQYYDSAYINTTNLAGSQPAHPKGREKRGAKLITGRAIDPPEFHPS